MKTLLADLLPMLLNREFAVADARAETFCESGGGFFSISRYQFGECREQTGLRQAVAVDAVKARFGPCLVQVSERHPLLFVVGYRLACVGGSPRCGHFLPSFPGAR